MEIFNSDAVEKDENIRSGDRIDNTYYNVAYLFSLTCWRHKVKVFENVKALPFA
jgi:hypothetical protein